MSFARLLDGTEGIPRGRVSFSLSDYTHEILAGGLPGFRHLEADALTVQLDSYLERIVDRDLPDAGYNVRRPAVARSWMRAYAAATGTTTTWTKIRDAATGATGTVPAKATALAYTELLTALRILDPVEAWFPTNNHLKRLTGSPKHFLADPALAARLLRLSHRKLLTADDGPIAFPRDGAFLGALFENLAAISVRTFAQSCRASVHHLRLQEGAREVDFVVERQGGVLGIEVKLAGAITDKDVRHLLWLREQLGDDLIDLVVLNTGPEAYRRPDGVAVVPLALLGP